MHESYGFDKIPIEQIYSSGYCTTIAAKEIVDKASHINNPSIYVAGTDGFKKEL